MKDMLDDSPTAATVTLTSFCSIKNIQDFKLDPPRTEKAQTALVLISAVLQAPSSDTPAEFLVDSVQLLREHEVATVKSSLKRMQYWTTLGKLASNRKQLAPERCAQDESPAKAARCRALSRHPTADAIPEFQSQS